MKLYYAPGACSMASHIALIENGAAYDKEKVDLKKHETESGEDFYDISPRGYVPAIETDDVGLLTENPAVLTYISDQGSNAPGGSDRYKMLEWLSFIGTELHGNFGPLFGGESEERQKNAKETLAKKFTLTETLMEGSQWLVGDAPGVADNYLFVTTLWADKFGVELPQSIKDYRARNKEREAVQQAMREEGLG